MNSGERVCIARRHTKSQGHWQDIKTPVLSFSCRRWELNSLQKKTVLSRPSFQFASVQSQIYRGLLKTWILETGSGQDKTVLSCLVRVGGVNWNGDETRQFCLVSTKFPIFNCSVSNISRTTENCRSLSPPSRRTRQDSFVLSVSAVWKTSLTRCDRNDVRGRWRHDKAAVIVAC